ncbi:MAG: porin family protein [Ignavibacteriae bacterium]|nr:porin family protein [Ignavibacteriota bacterium]
MKKIFVTVLVLFAFISLHAQRNPMSVGVNAEVSVPLGDFSDIASMGFGLNGAFIYGISDVFETTGSLGFISWSRDIPTITETLEASADGSFTSIPLLVGARYYFPQRSLMPYAAFEIGLHIFSTSDYTISIANVETTLEGATDVNFGFAFGGGAVYEVSKGFKVDGSLKYNIINGDPSSLAHLTLRAGVLFGIN